MACDQLGFAPLFISSMIGILAALEGKTLDAAAGVIRRDLPDAIRANWALWVPAQFLNFRCVCVQAGACNGPAVAAGCAGV
jgi:hypothetical protein